MKAATTSKAILPEIDLVPMKGNPRISIFKETALPRGVKNRRKRGAGREMTPADWDKFEKDIADAFEQVP